VYAAVGDGRLSGLALYDRESKLGTVFATDPALVRLFLKMSRSKHFFLEAGTTAPTALPPGIKPLDRFDLLALDNPSPISYDPNVVRGMRPDDLPAVQALAAVVYARPGVRWRRIALRDGDVAFVAEVGGQLAGFGFLTVADSTALLHGLTVAPGFRGIGLGNELTAARITAASELGVHRVLVEVSKGNPPVVAIARRTGFTPVGAVVYASRRPKQALDMEEQAYR
jgi:ribosomal protein S18 acetylase RimI-like enzyme